MKIRTPAVPIVTCTPDFSLWSVTDKLTDSDLQHWSNAPQPVHGFLKVGEREYCFMGKTELPVMSQSGCDVDVFTTKYSFECEEADLTLTFTTPLLLSDLAVMARPITYVDVECKNKTALSASVTLSLSDKVCVFDGDERQSVVTASCGNGFNYISVGDKVQEPLTYPGDMKPTGYGYAYIAAPAQNSRVFSNTVNEQGTRHEICCTVDLGIGSSVANFALAYDALYSIEYFTDKRPCFWKREADSMEQLIAKAFAEREDIFARCASFTEELHGEALAAGGEKYDELLTLAYRQTVGAHILGDDADGNLIFVSKECGSGAHAATVDVTYPSTPLFLKYCPDLVEAMIRPVFRFAETEVWSSLYKFAPHDVGFYPILNGQTYPEGRGLDAETQMPVEECANMLIITAALCRAKNDVAFAQENLALLKQWCDYLMDYGYDPGEQLCTDDFAGRLAHNCNLSVKAIMGIASFGIIKGMLGDKKAEEEHIQTARAFAQKWCESASVGDGTYRLAFDEVDSFSMKYNAVWDQLFGAEIFPKDCFKAELASYIEKRIDKYGMPLDNRCDYAKSDWILWAATMMESKDDFVKMITPMWNFYNESPHRVPMTDLYHTRDAKIEQFRNRTVQGGLFIKLLEL